MQLSIKADPRAVLQAAAHVLSGKSGAGAAREAEQYCWSPKIKCSPGQQLQNAFVLLPVDLSVVNGETLRLQVSSADVAVETLHQQAGHSLLPSDCGLRFDVTEHLARKLQQALCVKVLLQEHTAVGGALRCPPFLVTTWKHQSQGEG
ncbi:hypothetical protein SRHO_G00224000 [Serrasalmus rhombeus]